uniref:uS17m n=1 Tax=Polytomella magna TaxID=353565 RepID=UPI002240E501|nr:Chain Bq, uS17m [Polytomella magna]8APN_Bq Chain Bq, uS17m [Polytomella magna]8APO_Bq Chain Bq, uS17m [Polytomella magna]
GGFEFVGKVVSNRMQKGVVVAVNYVVWIPKYKVYERRTARHMAHDEGNSCVIGDIVRIQQHRKLSKNKAYVVVSTLKHADVYNAKQAAVLNTERSQNKLGRVEYAESRLSEVQQRLLKLREMYQKELALN